MRGELARLTGEGIDLADLVFFLSVIVVFLFANAVLVDLKKSG